MTIPEIFLLGIAAIAAVGAAQMVAHAGEWLVHSKPMTIRDAERICIARAKAKGASEYVFLDVGPINKENGSAKGKLAREIVDERWPDALIDPDESNYRTGRIALLLPLITTGERP